MGSTDDPTFYLRPLVFLEAIVLGKMRRSFVASSRNRREDNSLVAV